MGRQSAAGLKLTRREHRQGSDENNPTSFLRAVPAAWHKVMGRGW